MNSDLQHKLDSEDTRELFATLIGYVIFNHEKLNFEIISVIEIIERKLNVWRNLPDLTNGRILINYESNSNPIKSYTKQLPDSELRNLFGECVASFAEVQQKLAEIPDWFNSFPDLLLQCLKDENQLRNELVHSGFNFKETNIPREEITTRRRHRNHGKRKGSYEINVINRNVIIEFIEYQNKLIRFLEDIALWEVDEDFYCDYSRIILNSDRFEDRYVQYANYWLPPDQFSLDDPDDIEFLKTEGLLENHEEVLNFYKGFCDDLADVDYFRRNLKLKSKNVEYRSHIWDTY